MVEKRGVPKSREKEIWGRKEKNRRGKKKDWRGKKEKTIRRAKKKS